MFKVHAEHRCFSTKVALYQFFVACCVFKTLDPFFLRSSPCALFQAIQSARLIFVRSIVRVKYVFGWACNHSHSDGSVWDAIPRCIRMTLQVLVRTCNIQKMRPCFCLMDTNLYRGFQIIWVKRRRYFVYFQIPKRTKLCKHTYQLPPFVTLRQTVPTHNLINVSK